MSKATREESAAEETTVNPQTEKPVEAPTAPESLPFGKFSNCSSEPPKE